MFSIIRLIAHLWSLIEILKSRILEGEEILESLNKQYENQMADPNWKFDPVERAVYSDMWYQQQAYITTCKEEIEDLHRQIGEALSPDINDMMDNANQTHREWYADQISKLNRESYRKCNRKHSELRRMDIRVERRAKINMIKSMLEDMYSEE